MEFVFDVDLNSFLVDVEIDVLQILILISFERFIDTNRQLFSASESQSSAD